MLKTNTFCNGCKQIKVHTEMPIGDFCIDCGEQSTLIYKGKKIRLTDYKALIKRFKIGLGLMIFTFFLILGLGLYLYTVIFG